MYKKLYAVLMSLFLTMTVLPQPVIAEEGQEETAEEITGTEGTGQEEEIPEEIPEEESEDVIAEEDVPEEEVTEAPEETLTPETEEEPVSEEITESEEVQEEITEEPVIEEEAAEKPEETAVPEEPEPEAEVIPEEEPAEEIIQEEITEETSEEPEEVIVPEEEPAEEPEEPEEGIEIIFEPEEESSSVDSDQSNDDLLQQFLDRSFFGAQNRKRGSASDALQGNDLTVYNILKADIQDVAEGRRSSTEFAITLEDFGLNGKMWTASELGVSAIVADGSITSEASDAVYAKVDADYTKIMHTLLNDLPYDLYWFDKTTGYSGTSFSLGAKTQNGEWVIYLTGEASCKFAVAREYRDSGNVYLTDLSVISSISDAVNNAKNIASAHASEDDWNKLVSFRTEICDLVSYNHEAADNDDTPYGNPWQLIWVFDGDESTKVVCEGYSKAFKYLCDLSQFRKDISCITVSGTMSGGTGEGPHMWNIVTMEDQKNYLTDITNCDSGTIGEGDGLFMKGAELLENGWYEAVIEAGTGSQRTIHYIYDAKTHSVWDHAGVLDLSDTDYRYDPSDVPVTGVSLDQDQVSLNKGQTAQLHAFIMPEDASNKNVTWSSDHPEIASVNENGLVTANDTGTAVITVTAEDGGYTAVCEVTVQYDAAQDYEYTSGGSMITITKYIGNDTEIVIPSVIDGLPVKKIGMYAFSNNNNLTSVVIPDSVEYIGYEAFYNCQNIKKLIVPGSVKELVEGPFGSCMSLKSAGPIGSGADYEFGWTTEIPDYAFDALYYLKDIIIPEGITRIGHGSLANCTSLTSVVLPESLLTLGNGAFSFCNDLTEITISDRVTSIGNFAFSYCTSLTEVSFSDKTNRIGESAFVNCENLLDVTIPASVESIGQYAFGYTGTSDNYERIDGFKIHGYAGSSADIYAYQNGITFVNIDEESDFEYVINGSEITIIKYSGSDAEVTIPFVLDGKTVAKIGSNAFENVVSLTSVEIPDSVTDIGGSAFLNCTGLLSVTIPASVTSIGQYAFGYVSDDGSYERIEGFTITGDAGSAAETYANENGITFINRADTGNSFEYTSSGSEVTITKYTGSGEEVIVPSRINSMPVTGIGANAFKDCSNVKSIVLPDGIRYVGDYAFSNCTGLSSITVPASVSDFRNNPFYGCTGLTTAGPMGSGADYQFGWTTDIPAMAFEGCSGLLSISLPDTVTSFGENIFYGCRSLREIVIPAGIRTIPDSAFRECMSLTEVTIPDGVEDIDADAFSSCTGLQRVTIPQSVSGIYERAFFSCHNLLEITIPASVTTIGSKALGYEYNNKLVEGFTIYGYAGSTAETYANVNGITFFNIDESPADYEYTSDGSAITITKYIGESTGTAVPSEINGLPVTKIGSSAFEGCAGLTNISIPDSVTEIGSYVFMDCSNLERLLIPASVTDFGDCSFMRCPKLKTAGPVGSGADYQFGWTTAIPKKAFNYSDLTSIALPESITGIGAVAFANCDNLTSINIPDGVETLPFAVFSNCSSLTSVTIPDSVRNIELNAFSGCESLLDVTIPASVTAIGEHAFGYNRDYELIEGFTIHGYAGTAAETYANDNGITFADIDDPAGKYEYTSSGSAITITKYIGEDTAVAVPSEINGLPVTKIGNAAFEGCSGVTSITIPDSVTEIGAFVFSGCTNLESLLIPASVTEFGDCSFSRCSNLKTAGPVGSGADYQFGWTTAIPMKAFNYSDLTSITLPESITSIGYAAFASCSSLTSINIPDGVETLPFAVFSHCRSLASITIPDSVHSIERVAFSDCDSLLDVTIPASVTAFGDHAFGYTINYEPIEGFKIHGYAGTAAETYANENGITFVKIGDLSSDYEYTSNGTEITITKYTGNSLEFEVPSVIEGLLVTAVGDHAFADNRYLMNLTLPDDIKSIGEGAFSGCTNLQSITMPDRLLTIGTNAFSNCSSLNRVVLPDNVTSIGDAAFAGCSSLNYISIPNSVVYMGVGIFQNCQRLVYAGNTLSNSNIEYDWTGSIPDNAFSFCDSIVEISVPEYITSIGANACNSCSSLNKVYLEDGVAEIKDGAFLNCGSLTNITIPRSVTIIGQYALGYLSGGELVEGCTIKGYSSSTAEAYANENGITFVNIDEPVADYEYAVDGTSITITKYTGSNYEVSVPASINGYHVTKIGERAFENNTAIRFVGLPDCVIEIADGAFYACSKLDAIELSENLEIIGMNAFRDCSRLDRFALPKRLISIGDWAFAGCSSIDSITIPRSVTAVGNDAFSLCSDDFVIRGYTGTFAETYANENGIRFISMDNPADDYSYTSDGSTITILKYTGNSEEVTVPSDIYGGSVTCIGENAFKDCSSIKSITLPDGIRSIGDCAFSKCTGLSSITIPASVSEFGNNTFYDCTGLTTAGPIGSGADYQFGWTTDIPAMAFEGCSGLLSISLPDTVTSIGEKTFYGCRSLREIVIPAGIRTIPNSAFRECMSLTEVTIPDGVEVIDADAFSLCTRLQRFTIPQSVSVINDGAFFSCHNLLDITIPASVTTIGSKAIGYEEINKLVEGLTIHGYAGTAAETYANENGITFDRIDEPLSDYEYTSDGSAITITKYTGEDTEVIIPSEIGGLPVTAVGDQAFKECRDITGITIPDSVTSIGWQSFTNCSSLEEIQLPAALTEVADGAFMYCTGLTGLSIPDSVTRIAEFAFYGCTGLERITIPDSVTSIGAQAFYDCSGLVKVIIPAGVTAPEHTVFGGCTGLQTAGPIGSGADIEFGWTTEIPDYAFSDSCLSDVLIPSTVSSIGLGAFYGCENLESVTLPESLTSIGVIAFCGCNNMTEMTIPSGVTYIGERAVGYDRADEVIDGFMIYGYAGTAAETYANENGIGFTDISQTVTDYEYTSDGSAVTITKYTGSDTAVIIPSEISGLPVTAVGERAFYGCEDLESVTIPSSVTRIGAYAFCGCDNLTEITIPSQVTYIGEKAFGYTLDDEVIEEFTIYGSGGSAAEEYAERNGLIFVDTANPDTEYEYAKAGSGITITKYIGHDAEVVIPAEIDGLPVTVIGERAFDNCSWITSITVPDSVTDIVRQAFTNCSSLSSIKLSDNITKISDGAFMYCTALTGISIPDSVTEIESFAFYGCTGLESLTVPATVTKIGAQALNDCSGLKHLTIAGSDTEMEHTIFSGCTGLKTAGPIGSGADLEFGWTKKIPDNAFYSCAGLTEVTIPETATRIGNSAFYACENLTLVTIPESVVYIDFDAFRDCSSLMEVTIPPTVKGIGEFAFGLGVPGFTIYGYEDTEAELYALNYDVAFVALEKTVIPDSAVSDIAAYTYDGTEIRPEPEVILDGETLVSGKDYIVEYEDNVDAGTAYIYIYGKGIYTGTAVKEFTIEPKAITPAVTLTTTSYTYNGTKRTPGVKATYDGITFIKGQDYTVTYGAGRTNAGTYNVKVTMTGNYSGSKKVSFKINPKPITPAVTLDKKSYTYNGKQQFPAVTVKDGETVLTEGTDYEITYPAGMTNAGTYTVNVGLKGNYSGSAAAKYTINKASQSVTVKLSAETIAVGKTATVTVTGNQGKVTYKSDDTSVAEVSEDGTISANKVGTAVISVISAATTNYKKKTVKQTVSVVPGATSKIAVANKSNGIKVAWKAVAGATGYYIYRNGKLAKTVTSGTTTSWGDTKATSNCTKYVYKIVAYADTGKSTLSRSLTTYWLTRPAISSLTNSAAGKLTVKWDKNADATGYQVQVSTSSSFTSATTKTATIRNIATVSKVVGSLKKGTTYYVRVRSFLTKDGKNYYSMWSVVKDLKITK